MIVQDVPVSFSGMDTTVSINDTVHLHGTATQQFGNIVEWAWDIGNTGTFKVTNNGDTSFIAPAVENRNYLCVQRVKDDDGNVAKDTIKITVLRDAPLANAGKDTTVSIKDTARLHGSAPQQFGIIVEWAWDIGNTGTFNVTGKGDSTIIVPSLANLNYLCILRIKDDDGNVAKDTMTITVLQDVPVANAGKDVAVHSHSPFTLHGIATQQFGTIVTWEWNINGAGFITTSSGDTTITIPDLNVKSLQCTLRVTDDDGNNSSASVNLTNGLWDPIGTKGISDGFAGYLSFAIYDGTPYVTFQDSVNGRKATVMRYSGSAWEPVGKKGFSDSAADFQSLAIDNGTPYVAFRDFRNGRKTTVMRYNGSAWESVGQKGFSDSVADFHSLVIDNGTPFVAFRDVGTGSKVTVMRYNGTTWEPVGAKGFSDAGVSYLSLSIYNGTPHVAYCDLGQGYKVTVMRYNGAAWEPVGAKGFSDAGVSNLSLAIYNGTPYVAFSDLGNGIRTTVMRYNGSAWEPVGAKGFSDGNAFDQSLAIYNGTPYVAFNSGDNGKKTTVMRYNGNAWELVGTNGFSDVGSHDQTLVIYNGIPYVAFADGTSSKVSVMKFW
jgi:surface antigen